VEAGSLTALVVPAFEIDPIVRRWRDLHDPSARAGMPAHVTLLSPFVPAVSVNDSTLHALCSVLADFRPIDATFRRTGRFPETVYLAPEPDESFRTMTRALVARWPECPPYRGAFPDPIPHLTVADREPDETLTRVEREAGALLPIRTRLTEAILFAGSNRSSWVEYARIPLGR
jgi:hypothetical protein